MEPKNKNLIFMIEKTSKRSETYPHRETTLFLRQLCRLKNTLSRALRGLAPTKPGASHVRRVRYARVLNCETHVPQLPKEVFYKRALLCYNILKCYARRDGGLPHVQTPCR